jgi:hypothetical protein
MLAAGRFKWLAGAAVAAVLTGCGGRVDSARIDMVLVKGGTFDMGCTAEQSDDCQDNEKPAHSVTVKDFRISRYEITQKQWLDIMGNNPSYFEGDNLPVENVTWDDIQTFIDTLNVKTKPRSEYRLPTEAEWEYAARSGTKNKGYKYAGSDSINAVAWYTDNSDAKTHKVGTKAPNKLGLYDMSGNVWELVSDKYGKNGSPYDSSTKPDSFYLYRGGSWFDGTVDCRVSSRIDISLRPVYEWTSDPYWNMPVPNNVRDSLRNLIFGSSVERKGRAVSAVVEFLRWGYVDFIQYGIVKIVHNIRDIFKSPTPSRELRKLPPPHSALFGFRLASDP